MRHQPKPSATSDDTDRVYTPAAWSEAIVDLLPLSGRVLDPARGHGAFYDRFPAHCERLWCEVSEGRDFFDFRERVDWVVTNPPWSRILNFMQHAFTLADNVVFLVTTNHAYTKARVRAAADAGFRIRGILHLPTPPKPWPQSGFQLSAIWWQRGYLGQPETLHAIEELGESV